MIVYRANSRVKDKSELPPLRANPRPGLCGVPSPDTLVAHAETLRRYGFSVFPVRDKKPAVRWSYYRDRRVSRTRLPDLFRRPKRVNGIGVVTGFASGHQATRTRPRLGLLAVDFDDPAAYDRWAADRPFLALSLPTARTGRGVHVYAWSPVEIWCRLPGVGEIIGDSAHYIVLPPSWHPKAERRYEWVTVPADGWHMLPAIHPAELGLEIPDSAYSVQKSTASQLSFGTGGREGKLGGESGSTGGTKVTREDITPAEAEAVWASLPTGPGQRNAQILALVRRLRAMHHLVDATPEDVQDVYDLWWSSARHVVGTRDREVSWRDFKAAWKTCRVVGVEDFRRRLAEIAAPAVGPEAKIMAIAEYLQGCADQADRREWHLSSRTAAGACGIGQWAAVRWLGRLVDRGRLVLAKRGVMGVGSRIASTYRVA